MLLEFFILSARYLVNSLMGVEKGEVFDWDWNRCGLIRRDGVETALLGIIL